MIHKIINSFFLQFKKDHIIIILINLKANNLIVNILAGNSKIYKEIINQMDLLQFKWNSNHNIFLKDRYFLLLNKTNIF